MDRDLIYSSQLVFPQSGELKEYLGSTNKIDLSILSSIEDEMKYLFICNKEINTLAHIMWLEEHKFVFFSHVHN